MKPSRWPIALAVSTVSLGLIVGGAAYLSTTGVRAQSDGPFPSLSFVPDTSSLVGHLDVRALASSPLWEVVSRDWNERGAADELYERTGVDIFRDVEAISFSVAEKGESGKRERFGLVAIGGFDPESVARKLSDVDSESREYQGARIYRLGQEAGGVSLAVFPRADSTLLLGEESYLREMIDAGAGRRPRATGLLSSWSSVSLAGATFWATGSPTGSVLSALGGPSELPPLESFVLSGRLESDLSVEVRGRARDLESAEKLTDIVRGLVALGRLQSGSSGSELSRIAEAVSIERSEREIEVALSVPYETIRRLAERPGQSGAVINRR